MTDHCMQTLDARRHSAGGYSVNFRNLELQLLAELLAGNNVGLVSALVGIAEVLIIGQALIEVFHDLGCFKCRAGADRSGTGQVERCRERSSVFKPGRRRDNGWLPANATRGDPDDPSGNTA